MTDEVKALVEALKVTRQALMEIRHAQQRGPDWYTRGESGMYRQVSHWLTKGLEAAQILAKYEI